MLLRDIYTVRIARKLPKFELPLVAKLPDGVTITLQKKADTLHAIVDRVVDPTKLEVIKNDTYYKKRSDGTKELLPRIKIRDDKPPDILFKDFVAGLVFLTDAQITLSVSPRENHFIPETDKDRALLKKFGTSKAYGVINVQIAGRTFSPIVTSDNIIALMPRRVGLRIYADAIKLTLASAQYREMWRVLESAFQSKDYELVKLLADYEPAKRMEFDKKELKAMKILRDKASHAQSKAGVRYLSSVDHECGERIGRLKELAERVILTKKSWGYSTTHVEELAPLQGYTGPGSKITIFKQPSKN